MLAAKIPAAQSPQNAVDETPAILINAPFILSAR